MVVCESKNGDLMLRVRTVQGEVQVFVRIEGRDHVICGVTAVEIGEIQLEELLSARLNVLLGGLGDR